MSTVIKVENLSKQYRLGQVGTGTISHDINRWWHKVRGKEDPYLKIGETNDRTSKGESDYVWALKDINFEVQQGEVLGIIGRNGAGKSTLLKILSRTTAPTTGSVKIKGRVASLLEVGTGFHPELSGRDNIFLNGSILGMTKREIQSKFDEIVDFAGVERYIDTPVKRYSSGMYVRLAFAVAAYLDPEILIVDEVLAVGDAEFQKKCLGKMKDVSVNHGRTVLFVSHNLTAINQLCNKGFLLINGEMELSGDINSVFERYLVSNKILKANFSFVKNKSNHINTESLIIINSKGEISTEIDFGSSWEVRIQFEVTQECKNVIIGLGLVSHLDLPIRTSWQEAQDYNVGNYEAIFKEDNILFATGEYKLLIGITVEGKSIQYLDNDIIFTIIDSSNFNNQNIKKTNIQTGLIYNQMNMYVKKNI